LSFFALALALVLNVDSVTIAKAVWEQPTLVENLKAPATSSTGGASDRANAAGDSLKLLDQYLPIGWQHGFLAKPDLNEHGQPKKDQQGSVVSIPFTGGDFWVALLGWLITAVATLFGAPFWFDALQSITRLKGSGPSPGEKRTERAAAQ
jgi:hypothetical protein